MPLVHYNLEHKTIFNGYESLISITLDDLLSKMESLDENINQLALINRKMINSDESSILSRLDKDIDLLFDIYETDNKNEIKSFLLTNNYLIEILFDAEQFIDAIFGFNIKKIIEIHRDQEEDFEEIFIVIKSSLTANEARILMQVLMKEWFINILRNTRGKLNITEEPYEL